MATADYAALLPEVLAIGQRVGQYLAGEQARIQPTAIIYKGRNDLVSYADQQAEIQLVEALRRLLPEAGFIAEEGTAARKTNAPNWVIDPLDGTTNFLHHLPDYCVSIGLLDEGQIRLGVIVAPARQETYAAVQGGLATLNGKPIRVSATDTLGESLLATGFPYQDLGLMEQYLKLLHELMQRSHGLRRIGSAALDLAWVACGRFEGFFEYNLKPWDVAAGMAIVEAAGGVCTDFRNGEDCLFGRQIVAAGPIHAQLQAAIAQQFPSRFPAEA